MDIFNRIRRRLSNADSKDFVRFFDGETKKVVNIPRRELRPGTVRARIQGIEGVVWVLADKIIAGPIQHPPFNEGIRDCIRRIQAAFAEQRDLSFDEWEDGFRRDSNPDYEIALWLVAAEIYLTFTENETFSERRRDVFRCVVTCMSTCPETVWDVLELQEMTRSEAEPIVRRCFYGEDG